MLFFDQRAGDSIVLHHSMRKNLRHLFAAGLCALMLSACGGGSGVKQQLFPPSLSVQELRIEADGTWSLSLRLRNFSNVGMRMDTVEAVLDVAGHEATTLSLSPNLDVAAGSAELIAIRIAPTASAMAGLQDSLQRGAGVRYQLKGSIRSSVPRNRDDEFEFASQLNPSPGLDGVLR
jgi:hypothetical protein